ncbi:unnamed protein product [Cylindrotheca closterium]|uniref:tRNA (guanine(46)-N(7))-methyltransferase n=1 Tax=Cylindrotheca closterium TaxID=2856 RepID=A0AAD2FTY0_9STRA|nr:unnamed protein product [Cylindrotheca closterium]
MMSTKHNLPGAVNTESNSVYADENAMASRSRRRNRRRHGAAPRQLNPLKPQYCNLVNLWREADAKKSHPSEWVIQQYANFHQPFVLDIGCGEGEWALKTAQECPDLNILGLELRSEALTKDRRRQAQEMPNLALLDANVLSGDLKVLLQDIHKVGGNVAAVMVQCPDPHWKTKHRKRRILGPILLQTCYDCMSLQASLFVRTDVERVAQDISILSRHLFVEDAPDNLLERLCRIPTERMLYVNRKGGSMYQRTFRKRSEPLPPSDDENDEQEDFGSEEPLFGVYDY